MPSRCHKKLVAQPLAQMGTEDEAGDFRQDQGLVIGIRPHDPQLGAQGGEWKSADPGLGGGEAP